MRLFKILCITLFALVAVLLLGAYLVLRASLPQLNGTITTSALAEPVAVYRDERGMAEITAQNRQDLAWTTGFIHGQERFFQMDLLRRSAAGELSALLGSATVNADKSLRVHRFRHRAELALAALPKAQQQLLQHYADGVNAGLRSLSARPFEYFLLRQTPVEWEPADSLLVIYSMYLQLQYSDGSRDISVDTLHALVSPDWFQFLMADGSQWDAPLDNSQVTFPPLPQQPLQVLSGPTPANPHDQPSDLLPGSNNFAISGKLTPYQSAMLANDMHLSIRSPNIWYRLKLNWQEQDQPQFVVGLSLPGTPMVVVGSNGHLAWGFTNTQGDWSDVVRLVPGANTDEYMGKGGATKFSKINETIQVAGGSAQTLTVTETEFGPVIGTDHQGNALALRWVAHFPQAINLNLLELETTTTVRDASDIGHRAGMPAQNMMLADDSGSVGWTIAGPIPRQQLADNRFIASSDDRQRDWLGFISPADYPVILNPEDGRLWTANSRTIGQDFALIGDGGLALGARAQQIRNDLRQQTQFTESDLFAIQLDDRAIFLQRWQQLLLNQVLTLASADDARAASAMLSNWKGRAAKDDVGYLLTRQFRLKVRHYLFSPLFTQMEQFEGNSAARSLYTPLESAMWSLVSQQPAALLPEGFTSWNDLLLQAWHDTLTELNQEFGNWRRASWGAKNESQFRHPLSTSVPLLGLLTDMPASPQAGDSFMPRVQAPSFGASERLVVAPGHEENGILTMPSAQSGHPLSPYYRLGEQDWQNDTPVALLPQQTRWQLQFIPGAKNSG